MKSLPNICEICGKEPGPSGLILSEGQHVCEFCELCNKFSISGKRKLQQNDFFSLFNQKFWQLLNAEQALLNLIQAVEKLNLQRTGTYNNNVLNALSQAKSILKE